MPPVGVAEGSSLGVSKHECLRIVCVLSDEMGGQAVPEKTRKDDGATLPGLGLPEMHVSAHFGDGFTNVDL